MVKLEERNLQPADSPSRGAAEAVKAAYIQVRDGLSPSGWTMSHEQSEQAPGAYIVRLALSRDGIDVSACGFVIGGGPMMEFARPAHRRVKAALSATGEPEFRRLIETWAAEVQAGVAHRWSYEARR